MALWFRVYVNDDPIGLVIATRQDSEGDEYTYEVAVSGFRGPVRTYSVRHAYNDGALALVRAALDALPPVPPEPERQPAEPVTVSWIRTRGGTLLHLVSSDGQAAVCGVVSAHWLWPAHFRTSTDLKRYRRCPRCVDLLEVQSDVL